MSRVAGVPGPYWFFFYSFDCGEPIHVHVRRENAEAKFWLQPVALAWNTYNVSNDTFGMNDPSLGTLFNRRVAAIAIQRLLHLG